MHSAAIWLLSLVQFAQLFTEQIMFDVVCRGASPGKPLVEKKKQILVDALLQNGIKADQNAKARLYQYCKLLNSTFCL